MLSHGYDSFIYKLLQSVILKSWISCRNTLHCLRKSDVLQKEDNKYEKLSNQR